MRGREAGPQVFAWLYKQAVKWRQTGKTERERERERPKTERVEGDTES